MPSVLLIDDSKIFLTALKTMLSPELDVVGVANNGEDGFRIYQSLMPDLVLLDITMPNSGGKECLQKIIAQNSKAKVIMISGVGDEQTVKECIELGASAFVGKAEISIHDQREQSRLIQTVRKVLTEAEAA